MNASQVAGHSFRRGGATWAFQCNVSEVLVQRQGDWRSNCYKEYIVLSQKDAMHATKSMLSGIDGVNEQWLSTVVQAAASPAEHLPARAVEIEAAAAALR